MHESTPPAAPKAVASPWKVAAHRERVKSFLRGEPVFPVTLELDLTSLCSRTCRDCPSARADAHWSLDRPFLDRLFGLLAGETPGLLLTGGETTLSPLFPDTLTLAKRSGVREIAVVTNGSRLDDDAVAAALLEHASTIRLSLYDWESGNGDGEVLQKIGRLRDRVETTGSDLRIGVSLLTAADRIGALAPLLRRVVAAGAHWIYFHPRCRNWDKGKPFPEDQASVLAEIDSLRERLAGQVDIHVLPHRYQSSPLHFSAYHAAHFLMIVGADRKNYLGAEVKYNPEYAISDWSETLNDDFLRAESRLDRIAAHHDRAYHVIGSRHRGVLYSDFLQRLLDGDPETYQVLDHPPLFGFAAIL